MDYPMLNRRTALACAAALCAPAIQASTATRSFADRAVKMVVPFAPGGSNDQGARLVAPRISEQWGQPVVIDNKGGAGGAIGAQAVARAQPDGFTVLFHSNSLIIQPLLMKDPGYDPLRDFAPVSLLAQAPLVLVCHPSVPASNFSEFLALTRSKAPNLFYGSAGTGASQHLVGELFNSMAGTKMQHVPFKGSAPSLAAVMAGDIQATFDIIPNAKPLAESGRVRLLAVTSMKRNPSLPQVPTIHEGGVTGFEFNYWQALSAPRGTPAPVVQDWFAAVSKSLERKEVQGWLGEQGFELVGSTPAQLAEAMRQEQVKWGKVIAAAGIKVDA